MKNLLVRFKVSKGVFGSYFAFVQFLRTPVVHNFRYFGFGRGADEVVNHLRSLRVEYAKLGDGFFEFHFQVNTVFHESFIHVLQKLLRFCPTGFHCGKLED